MNRSARRNTSTVMSLLPKLMMTLALSLPMSSSYVTSGLPKSTHIAWLKKMTVNICEQPQGELTPEMLKATPQLMSAWSNLYNNDNKKNKKRIHHYKQRKQHGRDSALAVESLLKRLIDEQRVTGNPNAIPTTELYNCIMEGWVHSGEGIFAAERCEQILVAMYEQSQQDSNDEEGGVAKVQPNYESFKWVLMAWKYVPPAQFKDSPVRAQRILEWMGRLATMKNKKTAVSTTTTFPLPDADLYDIVLQLWARSGKSNAPQTCEQLVHNMKHMYEQTESPRLQPRTSTFNAVLAAWSKSSQKGAAQRASDVLGFMEYLSQEEKEEYYRQKKMKAAAQDDDTNEDMDNDSFRSVLRPDLVSYSTVVAAFARSNDPQAGYYAERFLKHVEAGYQAGETDLEPDTIFYNCVMGCWARSTEPGAYRKARSILDRQITLYTNHNTTATNTPSRCRPDVYGFTSVIGSCTMVAQSPDATTAEKQKAFGVALSTFQQFRNSKHIFQSSPNHVTYGTMLKACGKLLSKDDPQQIKWIRKIFRMCVADGCVGDMVLSKLRECATPSLYKELMQGYTKHTIPSEWTCNVYEQREAYRKQPSSTTTTKPAFATRKRAEV